jgi:hypothetical protein
MSASTIAPASAIESPDWQFAEEDAPKPASLIVQLRRSAFVFPWFRFVYAEGDNTKVDVVFATHSIRITGHGLAALLAALAGQRVIRVIEPSENEAQFSVRGVNGSKYQGPAIHRITVTKFGEEE